MDIRSTTLPSACARLCPKGFLLLLAWLVGGSLLTGCGEKSRETPAPSAAGGAPTTTDGAPTATVAAALAYLSETPLSEPEGGTWDAIYIQGTKVGYVHTAARRVTYQGRTLLLSKSRSKLELSRFEQTTKIEYACSSWETSDGELLRFECHSQLGSERSLAEGSVEAGHLVVETISPGGGRRTTRTPLAGKCGGFHAVYHSLRRQPLQPGESRSLWAVVPSLNMAAEMVLTAHDYEATPLADPNATSELLRITSELRLEGNQVTSTMWTDRAGEVLKSEMPGGLETVTLRTTRDAALAPAEAVSFDLGVATSLPLPPTTGNLHTAQRARYRLTLPGGDPATLFLDEPAGGLQRISAETVEFDVVRKPASGESATGDAAANIAATDTAAIGDASALPGPEYREPSALVESDDPLIVALAAEAAAGQSDPRELALQMERFVRERITQRNYTQAFATAAEVARSREGDCTEHAALLAALLRARGVPSRAAVGLVYFTTAEGQGALGYHMWTEAYLDGQWVSLDATLAQGGTGAGHVRLATTPLKDLGSHVATMLPLLQAFGKLQVDVVSVEP